MYNKWYVLHVRTGSEKYLKSLLEDNFSGSDLSFIVPILILRKKINRVWIETEKVMLPGYILINGNVTIEDYYKLKRNSKIYSLLRDDDGFIDIPQHEIELLGQLINEDGYINESYVDFDINNRVIIIDGPLKGLEGYIEKVNKHTRRATLKTEFMGIETRIKVGINFINKI